MVSFTRLQGFLFILLLLSNTTKAGNVVHDLMQSNYVANLDYFDTLSSLAISGIDFMNIIINQAEAGSEKFASTTSPLHYNLFSQKIALIKDYVALAAIKNAVVVSPQVILTVGLSLLVVVETWIVENEVNSISSNIARHTKTQNNLMVKLQCVKDEYIQPLKSMVKDLDLHMTSPEQYSTLKLEFNRLLWEAKKSLNAIKDQIKTERDKLSTEIVTAEKKIETYSGVTQAAKCITLAAGVVIIVSPLGVPASVMLIAQSLGLQGLLPQLLDYIW